jgi:purine-nucleoside phosphorylase
MLTEEKMRSRLNTARSVLVKRFDEIPDCAVILGSGLGEFADQLEDVQIIPYEDIPNFPVPTVMYHKGNMVSGRIGAKSVLVLQGRLHYYEGYDIEEVTFPVRLLQFIGLKRLIVTNAAGGINECYHPGQLILMKDHINLMGINPLRGENLSCLGERFPDMSEAYDKAWRRQVLGIMEEMGLVPAEGVYAAVSGPSFETPAEIRYLRTIGADLVGMSTVPEVIVAGHARMKVLGISCVTNMAAGMLEQRLTHEEVKATTELVASDFARLLRNIVGDLPV